MAVDAVATLAQVPAAAKKKKKGKPRHNLSYEKKIEIMDYALTGSGKGRKHEKIVGHFRSKWAWVTKNTVCKILQEREKLGAMRKKDPDRLAFKRPGHFKWPEVEAVMTL